MGLDRRKSGRTFFTTFSATLPTSTLAATAFPFSLFSLRPACNPSNAVKGDISMPRFAGPGVLALGGRWLLSLYIADGFEFVNLPLARYDAETRTRWWHKR